MRSAFTQAGFYPFEGPATIDLSLIPLSIRYKLDRAEIKLHLSQWQKISLDDRQRLLDTPCGTAAEITGYRALLLELIERYFSAPPTSHPLTTDEPWADSSRWPQVVIERVRSNRPRYHLSEDGRHSVKWTGMRCSCWGDPNTRIKNLSRRWPCSLKTRNFWKKALRE